MEGAALHAWSESVGGASDWERTERRGDAAAGGGEAAAGGGGSRRGRRAGMRSREQGERGRGLTSTGARGGAGASGWERERDGERLRLWWGRRLGR